MLAPRRGLVRARRGPVQPGGIDALLLDGDELRGKARERGLQQREIVRQHPALARQDVLRQVLRPVEVPDSAATIAAFRLAPSAR